MLQRLIELARANPAKTALVFNGISVSYAEFTSCILAFRKVWATENLLPGGVAVVPSAGHLNNWCAILALRSLGLTTVCIPSLERIGLLQLQNVACLVLRDLQDATATPWPHTRRLQLPALPLNRPATPPTPAEPEGVLQAGAHILLSSGTTGTAKKLVFDGALDTPRAQRSGQFFSDDSDTVLHIADFGPWTGVGYKWPLRVWQHGGTVVVDQRPDWPRHFFAHAPTAIALTPPLAAQLLAGLGATAPQAPHTRPTVYLGGALPAAALVRDLLQRGDLRLIHFFGATELLPSCMACEVDDPAAMDWLQVQPDRQVEVVTEDGAPCPDGEHGLLRIRLDPLDCQVYLDDPLTTAKVFRDGCFYPGDLAVRRADGHIRILGRTADVINVAGRKLPSGPLEEKVREALGVASVCAFSGPDDRGEHSLLIAIETSHRITRERLLPLADSLRSLGRLRFAQVPEFPRTRNGTRKIDRLALRRLVMEEMSRSTPRPAKRP